MKVRGDGLKGHLDLKGSAEGFPGEALKRRLKDVSRCPLVSSKTAF